MGILSSEGEMARGEVMVISLESDMHAFCCWAESVGGGGGRMGEGGRARLLAAEGDAWVDRGMARLSFSLLQGDDVVMDVCARSPPGLESSVHGVMAGLDLPLLEPVLLRGDWVDDAAEVTFSDSEEAVLMALIMRVTCSAGSSERYTPVDTRRGHEARTSWDDLRRGGNSIAGLEGVVAESVSLPLAPYTEL
jgi:hypothetical protein